MLGRPRQPAGLPPQDLLFQRAQAPRPTRRRGERQQHQQAPPVDDNATQLPFFFGAAARKRARELLGQDYGLGGSQPDRLDDYEQNSSRHGRRRHGKGGDGGASGPGAPHVTPTRAAPRAVPSQQLNQPPSDTGEVKWLSLENENSPLVEAGLTATAPVILWTKELQASGVLSGIGSLAQTLVGDVDLEIHHDAEWKDFPEVCSALRQLELKEVSYCLAVCPAKCRWGVGVAGKWKSRELAAKLALSMQLAQEEPCAEAASHPGFAAFCQAAGMPIVGGADVPMFDEPPAKSRRPRRNYDSTMDSNGAEPPWQGKPQSQTRMPRDKPVWIALPAEEESEPFPEILKGMPADTLAIASEGNRRKMVYKHADDALELLTHGSLESIKLFDDCKWDEFPMVGAALKAVAEKEECMTVAFFDLLNVWGVGVSMKKFAREQAAKVALATMLALQAEDQGDENDFSEMEDFGKFVQEAKLVREEFLRNAAEL